MKTEHNFKIIKNDYGYYEVSPKVSQELLDEYYTKKYFQSEHRYSKEYSIEEKDFLINNINRKLRLVERHLDLAKTKARFLEIGVGEGWTLNHFNNNGFEVTGVDFSDYAVKNHNPEVAKYVTTGSPDNTIKRLVNDSKVFDLIWLDNVLEHSPDPKSLLLNLNELCEENGLIIIEVPNDYSDMQLECKRRGFIESNFWESPPEHLSYFSLDSLKSLATDCGWDYLTAMTNFPIDIFLLNESSNYNKFPEKGKSAHMARVIFENLIAKKDPDHVINFYQEMLKIGIGREITAVFNKRG